MHVLNSCKTREAASEIGRETVDYADRDAGATRMSRASVMSRSVLLTMRAIKLIRRTRCSPFVRSDLNP